MPRPDQPGAKSASLRDDGLEETAGAVEVFAAAGAGHEGGEDGAGLEVVLGGLFGERARRRVGAAVAGGSAWLQGAEALQGAEDLVADFRLDGDEIEGGDVDGAAGADALRRRRRAAAS